MKNHVLFAGEKKCTGCGMCGAICPLGAIAVGLNENGFYRPVVDEDRCADCGMCQQSCYQYDNQVDQAKPKGVACYSAVNRNAKEVETATSGGVTIELMRACLANGYAVAGAAYDYHTNLAVTKIARKEEELEQFKGSKYFQSDCSAAFREMVQSKEGQKYAVFGTPCQLYALARYATMRGRQADFLLIDLFCHGIPSKLLWDKYAKGYEQKMGGPGFDRIEFRSKAYGWHEYSNTFHRGGRVKHSPKAGDPFYELFFDNQILGVACYQCTLRSSLAYVDLRVGDFWGSDYAGDTKGVSAVVACTARGKELFEQVRGKFIVGGHSFEQVVAAQSYGKVHRYDIDKREKTLELLKTDQDMEQILKQYRRSHSLSKRMKGVGKRMLKRLPKGCYATLRQTVQKNRRVP